MRKKISQKEAVMLYIIKQRKLKRIDYIPAWELVGDRLIAGEQTFYFFSYKCPARLSDLFKTENFDNGGWLERTEVKGKSGSKYEAYRVSPEIKNMEELVGRMKDGILKEFFIHYTRFNVF
jgi:hypothetical protein